MRRTHIITNSQPRTISERNKRVRESEKKRENWNKVPCDDGKSVYLINAISNSYQLQCIGIRANRIRTRDAGHARRPAIPMHIQMHIIRPGSPAAQHRTIQLQSSTTESSSNNTTFRNIMINVYYSISANAIYRRQSSFDFRFSSI